jgi:hypothetical protein
MSLATDLEFIDSISSQLRNFKKKEDYVWNFSCPICGDSKKNKLKARGYLFRGKDGLIFKCHNAGPGCIGSGSFANLVKAVDPTAYKEYALACLKDKGGVIVSDPKPKRNPAKPKKAEPAKPSVLIGCPSIATLGSDHPASIYIKNRLIPEAFWKQLFWTDDFAALVDKVSPDHQFKLVKEGRIVIPFLDRDYRLLAIQGRSLDPNAAVRYITIKAYQDAPRIYGMHRLGNAWKRIYVVEGPFDSMFLPNCLAMAGSDIPRSLPIDKVLIAYDNEPTKEDTRHKLLKAIEKGYRVCIWPDTIQEKDINEMVLAGYIPDKIRKIIDKNSYTGTEAKIKLQMWHNAVGKYPGKPRKDNEQE